MPITSCGCSLYVADAVTGVDQLSMLGIDNYLALLYERDFYYLLKAEKLKLSTTDFSSGTPPTSRSSRGRQHGRPLSYGDQPQRGRQVQLGGSRCLAGRWYTEPSRHRRLPAFVC